MTAVLLLSLSAFALPSDEDAALQKLGQALTFHAGFDGGTEADFALGDRRLHTSLTGNTADGQPGMLVETVVLAKNAGRYGDALRFEKKQKALIYYQAEKNVHYRPKNWSGTISIWLSLDPQKDLEPGYCDPFQVTDKKWSDACIWVDFSKDEVPRYFRLGIFSDTAVWNPKGRTYDDIPDAERPLITVKRPPFGRGKWTHVVATFSGFNRDAQAGIATFYLNGEPQGGIKGRQVFSWKLKDATIRLGINYIGLMDDLAVFNRALTPKEVGLLYRLPGGVAALKKKNSKKTSAAN